MSSVGSSRRTPFSRRRIAGAVPAAAPASLGSRPDDLNLNVQALHPLHLLGGDFLGNLLEVVAGQAAPQDQHAAPVIARRLLEG